MLPILIIVCIVESVARYYTVFGLRDNYLVYNSYIVLSTPIYFALFGKIIPWKRNTKIVYNILSGAILLFMIFDLLYLEPGKFASYTMIIVLVSHILLSCVLLSFLAMDESREIQFIKEPYFWIAAGLLLFSAGTVVLLGLQSYILNNGLTILGKPLYQAIVPMLNVVLYSCYSYAFYLCFKYRHRLGRS